MVAQVFAGPDNEVRCQKPDEAGERRSSSRDAELLGAQLPCRELKGEVSGRSRIDVPAHVD